jgi:hypothetical protein
MGLVLCVCVSQTMSVTHNTGLTLLTYQPYDCHHNFSDHVPRLTTRVSDHGSFFYLFYNNSLLSVPRYAETTLTTSVPDDP